MFGILLSSMVMFTAGQASLLDNDTAARIINGIITDIEDVPWQVSLQACHFSQSPDCFHQCGGSIINEKWVLTAAHCVDSKPYLKISIGSANNQNGGSKIEINRIVIHENWDRSVVDFDYALLELSKPLNFSSKISPITLPSTNDELSDGTLCEVSGWGLINNNGETDKYLRMISVPIVNQTECLKAYSKENKYPKLTSRMICGKQDGKGVCRGDSGSPMSCKLKDCETRKLFGVVSWGSLKCAQKGFPGVYARVSAAREWIGHVTGV